MLKYYCELCMYGAEIAAVGHCGFSICATWSSSSLLTADLQTPDLGEHVGAVLDACSPVS